MAEITEDDSSIMSDTSFVILGQGSLTLDVNDTAIESIGTQPPSLHDGLNPENGLVNDDSERNRNSAFPCTSSFGINLKLEKLVKENLMLKETLNQSNLTMKNQFDTLALWHEEVVKTHESHKQKFQETQDQIFKLRNENLGLKKLIQQNMERCYGNNPGFGSSVFDGASSVDMLTDLNCKEVNFHYIYIEELRSKTTELEGRICDMKAEKLDLEKKLEKVLEENRNLKKYAESKNDKCIQCQGSKSLISDKTIKGEEGKCNELKSLDMVISINNELTESVEDDLDLSSSKKEISELRKQLAKHSEVLLESGEKLEEVKRLHEELFREKNELKNELEQSKINIEKLENKTTNLNEELKKKEEEVECKVLELEQIKREMQKLVLNCEEVVLLQAQVELYQNDFNEERRAREQAVGEKEKMAEQVRFLERTLNDLRKNEDKKENEQQKSTSIPAEEKNKYICPKCMKRLPTLTECESHVDACLDSDIFP